VRTNTLAAGFAAGRVMNEFQSMLFGEERVERLWRKGQRLFHQRQKAATQRCHLTHVLPNDGPGFGICMRPLSVTSLNPMVRG